VDEATRRPGDRRSVGAGQHEFAAVELALEVGEAGPYGVTVRAMPANPAMISPYDLGVVAWAG